MDKKVLEQYVRSVAGDDPDIASKLLDALGSKEDVGQRFLDGFLRQSDATKKWQEAADVKKQSETLITDYEGRLEEAEKRIKDVMKAASQDKITAATARAQLDSIKQSYGLTDDDIPSAGDVIKTVATGKIPSGSTDIDIDAKLTDFKQSFMKELSEKLLPEMSGMAAMPVIWNTISRNHYELTGAYLSDEEQIGLLKEAREKNTSLKALWESKYNIPELRLQRRDADLEKTLRDKWEKEQTARRSEEVLSGTKRNGVEIVPDSQKSPLFRKQQQEALAKGRVDPDAPALAGKQQQQQEQQPPIVEQRMSGADRAAQSFLARRAKGIGWGEKEAKAS